MAKSDYTSHHHAGTSACRAALLVGMLLAVFVSLAFFTFSAEAESSDVKPIRSVHKVTIGSEEFCFHVQHNVVLTREAIEKIEKDEDLTSVILEAAGFYMKAPNCTDTSHPVITAQQWADKTKGSIYLNASDVADIRNADPEDGSPVKFYLDICATRDAKDPKEDDPSTFQRTCPAILFVVVATDNDAKYEPAICEEAVVVTPDSVAVATAKPAIKKPAVQKKLPSPEDALPENKTIKMTDRSGAPVETTLKDGDPVTLEWIEANNHQDKANSGNPPSKITKMHKGLIVAAVIIAMILAAIIFIIRKRSQME